MKAESDPITPDEWLLRRIWGDRFCTAKVPIISPGAFEPRSKGRDPDTEGISFYRLACLGEPAEILTTVAPEKRINYAIVQLPVQLLQTLQLSVRSQPDERIKGHVVIPELNSLTYASDRARLEAIQLKLATAASEPANILQRPNHAGS